MTIAIKPSGWCLQKADVARDARRWAVAVRWYRRYVSLRPADARAWVQLGNCAKEAGDLAGALEAYKRAERLIPDDSDLHLQLGHLAKVAGRKRDALIAYKRAVSLDPTRIDAIDELDRLRGTGDAGLSGDESPRFGVLVRPERDRALNLVNASRNADQVALSNASIDKFRRNLPKAPEQSDNQIPRMLHFVFGFKGNGDLPFYGCLAIRSALHFNPGWTAYYYTMNAPSGPHWDSVKDNVTLVQLDDFSYFGNARVIHYAHKADIVRMLILNQIGGLYLDVDTITQRSFEDLRGHDFVMGVQAAGPNSSSGLCNAVMLGKPGAAFSTRWLREYDYFRSQGRDDLWDYHSVKLPVWLAAKHPEEITVLDYRAFFYPLWTNIRGTLFSEASEKYQESLTPAYCFHLWNGTTGVWLDEIDGAYVTSSKSVYAAIARQVMEGSSTPQAGALMRGRGR
jgi:tetratricopeptide (TPR) repeat protein